jgi:hypothetical protein
MDEINKNKYSHVINVSVVDPLSGLYSAGTLLLLKEKRKVKSLWYATVEGYFRRTMFSEHVLPRTSMWQIANLQRRSWRGMALKWYMLFITVLMRIK